MYKPVNETQDSGHHVNTTRWSTSTHPCVTHTKSIPLLIKLWAVMFISNWWKPVRSTSESIFLLSEEPSSHLKPEKNTLFITVGQNMKGRGDFPEVIAWSSSQSYVSWENLIRIKPFCVIAWYIITTYNRPSPDKQCIPDENGWGSSFSLNETCNTHSLEVINHFFENLGSLAIFES